MTENRELTLYDFLRMGHIKRWHNVNTTREQTVAEHAAMVAIIALQLFKTMKPVNGPAEGALAQLVIAALFHDMPEIVTGDIPTPGKAFIREFTGNEKIFDDIEQSLLPVIPFIDEAIDERIAIIIKLADAIEAVHWITENGAGAHAKIVANANWRKLEQLTYMHCAYEAVNEVLVAMNMRYIHRESRITPP